MAGILSGFRAGSEPRSDTMAPATHAKPAAAAAPAAPAAAVAATPSAPAMPAEPTRRARVPAGALIAASWIAVALPLGWGVAMTLKKALLLFG